MQSLPTEVRTAEANDVDPLFAALDHYRVPGIDGDDCDLQVLAIHRNDRDVWVQLAPATNPAASFLLHLSPWAKPAHAVAAIRRWSPARSYPQVIDVMTVIRTADYATPPANSAN